MSPSYDYTNLGEPQADAIDADDLRDGYEEKDPGALERLRDQLERQLNHMVGSAKDSKMLVALIALSSPLSRVLTSKAATRIPGVRRLPMLQLLLAGQILLLAKQHLELLDAQDRHRLLEITKSCHGDPRKLSTADRQELQILLNKVEPKLFMRTAAVHVIRGRAVSKKSQKA